MNRSIKNSTWIVTAVTISVLGFACNSNQSASSSAQTSQPSQAWTLQYQASCDASTDPTTCAGAYGFAMNADGTYDVGPGPQGQKAHGTLDADDFKALTDAAASVLSGEPASRAESCNEDFSAANDYTLTLIRHEKKSEVMHKTGADLCSAQLDADPAEALHNLVIQLVAEYYPNPFPDACLEAAQAVQALYPAVQTCHQDSDCGYLNPDYTAIDADSISQVYTDNCSEVAALPAANIAAVQAAQAKLQAALANAQQVCGDRIARSDCSGAQSFASSVGPAVCQLGVCQVSPNAAGAGPSSLF